MNDINKEMIVVKLKDLGDESWNASPQRGHESNSVNWVKVFELASHQLTIGLSDSGTWARSGKATVELTGSGPLVTFLPCLELSYNELLERLRNGLESHGLPSEFAVSFPYIEILKTALTSESEYWTKLALERISDSEFAPSLEQEISDAAKNAVTQKLRHQAKALIPR